MDVVYLEEDVVRILGSRNAVVEQVRLGKFPAPFYVAGTEKHPRGKRWLKSAVDNWLEERARLAKANGEQARVIAARLVRARREKPLAAA
jgi:hypothetical protein